MSLMTLDDTLAFLRRHQPLPGDGQLTRDQLEKLDDARSVLSISPSEEGLWLLLGVFGEGSGFGVYQLLEDTVAAYPRPVVITFLERRLLEGSRSVRYWCSQIASGYPDDRLVTALSRGLVLEDLDLRAASLGALEAIRSERSLRVLRSWLPSEVDAELRQLIQEALG